MNRRAFLSGVGKSSLGVSLLLGGVPIKVLANQLALNQFTCEDIEGRVLVIVQLGGGNDGLNTLIPLDQYSLYRNYRPKIGIKDTGSGAYQVLDSNLPGKQQIGLQPDMMALKDIYEDGKINIIQDVCYPNPNKSHFKSTDLWLTGQDGNSTGNLASGWIGRYMNKRFPNYPAAYPNVDMPDPIGIQLGTSTTSLGFFRDDGTPLGMPVGKDPVAFFQSVINSGGSLPNVSGLSHYEKEIGFINQMELDANDYAARLKDVYLAGSNVATYPTNHPTSSGAVKINQLAPQFQTVARLLSGGIQTKIFVLRHGGFDHHTKMTSTDPSKGHHGTLLYHLVESMKAFQKDLEALGLADRVLTVTFSEFGRTVTENGNLGTDHGTSAPMILMGKAVNAGVTGVNPNLSNVVNNNFTTYQHDYRSVFTTLLQDWFGANTASLQVSKFDQYENQKLPLINNKYVDPGSGDTYNFVADTSCDPATFSTFPVEFLGFELRLTENWEVECLWSTANEKNNADFVVERSVDGTAFQRIGTVPGLGNSQNTQQYSFLDGSPLEGRAYYRIKQVDFDGSFSFTQTKSIVIDPNQLTLNCRFSPNPVVDKLNVDCFASQDLNQAYIRLFTMNGATLRKDNISLYSGSNQFQIPMGSYAPGIYFVEIFSYVNGSPVRLGSEKVIKR